MGQDISRFLQSSYSFEDLIRLVEEYERLYPSENFRTFSAKKKNLSTEVGSLSKGLRKYEPFIKQANQILFNRNDTVIEEKNWIFVVPMIARYYSIYQYFDYFLVDKKFDQIQALLDLGALVDQSLILIEDTFQPREDKRFSDDELQALIMAAVQSEFLPKNLSEKTVRDAIQAILQHILFDPAKRLNGETNRHFSKVQIEILKSEFKGWLLTQIKLNEIFNDDAKVSLAPGDLLIKIREQISLASSQPELLQGLTEVESVIDSLVTQTLDTENQLQISNRTNWTYFKNATFQINLNRVLARVLLRSFSTDPSLSNVTECNAQMGFGLLVGIFRDLEIFDPSETFISSRFLEANIFMVRADGNKLLNYFELSELIGVIFSGLKVNSNLEASLRTVCPIRKDKQGFEYVTFLCLSEHHYVAVRKFMTQLPEFKSFVERISSKDKQTDDEFFEVASRPGFADWNIIFRSAFKATGWIPNNGYDGFNQESVYFSDILYYPFVIHYLEYVFARFDSTKNGALQVFEARKAFPVFQPLLKDLAKEQLDSGTIKESDLLAVFTYILKYKEQPSSSSLVSIARWLRWRSKPENWDLWVTRAEMSQILGYIADQTASLKKVTKRNLLQCQ